MAVQDALRAVAAGLPEPDVLELLAVAPGEPAERAAYLALIGQDAQRMALDPEGALLALAYRAAGPEVRERLRGVLAAGGDTEMVRVVVTGERRDRVAELSHEELDYLGRQLAEGGRWDELRRLAADLPLAGAAAATRLLPEAERVGEGGELLSLLAAQDPERLRATAERLPRERETAYPASGGMWRASFSPDGAELAVRCTPWGEGEANRLDVWAFRIGTGESTHILPGGRKWLPRGSFDSRDVLLHLGDEILLVHRGSGGNRVVRLGPEPRTLTGDAPIPVLRRTSGGAVLPTPRGLAFADRGAGELRQVVVDGFPPVGTARGQCVLATLPEAGLVAVLGTDVCVVTDERGTVLHRITTAVPDSPSPASYDRPLPALSFLGPETLALQWTSFLRRNGTSELTTETWSLPPGGTPRMTARHPGPARTRWSLEEWRRAPLDPAFAASVFSTTQLETDPAGGHPLPWFDGEFPTDPGDSFRGQFLAMAPGGDTIATGQGRSLTVRSRHLPTARGLLERPLLHVRPQDLAAVREVRPEIGDADVRGALGLLAACLEHRLGGDIALTTGAGPVSSTHLTLPTKRIRSISLVHVSFK
ncbi:hypothetical protein, partial [Streptomyces sp. SBT349]|uniref:hypothetical protein n=1 Tax=Streptomyces sp. SBT349 TaxID=1580539 RepID=UPI00066D19FF